MLNKEESNNEFSCYENELLDLIWKLNNAFRFVMKCRTKGDTENEKYWLKMIATYNHRIKEVIYILKGKGRAN